MTARHVPPPAGVRPPGLWGTPAHLDTLFGDAAGEIDQQVHTFNFRYKSPEHFVEVLRTYYGPTHKAFASLDAEGQRAYEHDLLALLLEWDRGGSNGLVVPAEYLEAVITRQ